VQAEVAYVLHNLSIALQRFLSPVA